MLDQTELVGVAEVAVMGQVTKQAVINWRRRYRDFPAPFVTLAAGPIFLRSEIRQWLDGRNKPR
jgi:chromosome partitioning protein